MVTVAITATVFAMIGGILVSVIGNAERIEKMLKTEKAGYGVLATLRRDLTGVYAYALGGPAFKGEAKDIGGRDADNLAFVTTARVLPAEDGRSPPALIEVAYTLREGEPQGSGLTLFRRAAAFEGDPLDGPEEFSEIYTGIDSLKLTYLDSEDKQWKETWEEPDRLPLAVKVELKLTLSEADRAAAEEANLSDPETKFAMIVGIAVKIEPKADPPPAAPAQPGQ
jgi:hypothetical protein